MKPLELPQRVPKKQSRTSFLVSIILHILLAVAVFVLAAREGLFGKKMKEITAVIVPKEEKKPEPQKPKEEPKPEPAKQEAKAEVKTTAPAALAAAAPPPSATAAAPPPAIGADFDFNDGRAVQTTTADPLTLYKQTVEYAFRSRWLKPDGMDDTSLVVEADISVNPDGAVTGVEWKRGSGDSKWDATVRAALEQTKTIGRKPPKDFPGRFLVRFDAVADTEPVQ